MQALKYHPPSGTATTFGAFAKHFKQQSQNKNKQDPTKYEILFNRKQMHKKHQKSTAKQRQAPHVMKQLAFDPIQPSTVQTTSNEYPNAIWLPWHIDWRLPHAQTILTKHLLILYGDKDNKNKDLYPYMKVANKTHFNLSQMVSAAKRDHILFEQLVTGAGCRNCIPTSPTKKCSHVFGLI